MIENITDYNKENLKVFINFALKTSRIISYVSVLIVLICSAINLILEPTDWVFSLVLILIVVFSTIIVLLSPSLYLKKATKMPMITNKYVFSPDKIYITTFSGGQQVTNAEWDYSVITKVIEKKDLLLLFINKNQALIVDNKKFNNINDKEIVKRYITQNVSRETKK